MHPLIYVAIALGVVALFTLITSYICYIRVFYCKRRKIDDTGEVYIPRSALYDAHREQILDWVNMTRGMKYEEMTITSHDGLTLYGRYYEYEAGAPIELLFHGYRGNAERDLSGGVDRCFRLKRNALIIDQRACGHSEGRTTTFGINEAKDCLLWVDYACERFGKDVRLILTGVSMGAATVMIASGDRLPENVLYTLADCGYTSAKEIIKKVIREMGLPAGLLYPFVRLGAFIFGHFNVDATSPIEAVKHATVPIVFIHGDNDDFVPSEMSERLYEACSSKKKISLIPEAGHGVAFPHNQELYMAALTEFWEECGF